jgi:hypothetical protein
VIRKSVCLALAGLAFAHGSNASACVPIVYGMDGITAASVAEGLVADSSRVEVMRVTARRAVDTADPLYLEYYAQVYEFQLETIEVIDGRAGPRLALYGFKPDWLEQRLPNVPRVSREPLWWLLPRGYEGLQEMRLVDPADPASITCAAPMTFELGADYLVFRTRSGGLVAPAFNYQGRPARPAQRPSIERVGGPEDLWLREVRRAVRADPQPPPSFWLGMFEIIFGPRHESERKN